MTFPIKMVPVPHSAMLEAYRSVEHDTANEIGEGLYAKVMTSKDGQSVYKISKGDSGYLSYLRSMTKAAPNPYFPHIESVTVFYCKEDTSDFAIVAKMERLTPYDDDSMPNGIKDWADCICKMVSKSEYFMETSVIESMEDYMEVYFREMNGLVEIANIDTIHMDRAVTCVANTIIEYGGGNDLHYGNLMFRKTNSGFDLVITDPISSCGSGKVMLELIAESVAMA